MLTLADDCFWPHLGQKTDLGDIFLSQLGQMTLSLPVGAAESGVVSSKCSVLCGKGSA